MSIKRIKTAILHSWYHFRHSMETWVDVFWNSALQMLVFSFIAAAFVGTTNELYGAYIVVGMILWNIVWSAEYAMTIGVLWEIWSHSLSTLLISPLTLEDFLLSWKRRKKRMFLEDYPGIFMINRVRCHRELQLQNRIV